MTLTDTGIGCLMVWMWMMNNHPWDCAEKIGCKMPEVIPTRRRDTNSTNADIPCGDIPAFRDCINEPIPNLRRNALIGGSSGGTLTLIICLIIIVKMLRAQQRLIANPESAALKANEGGMRLA